MVSKGCADPRLCRAISLAANEARSDMRWVIIIAVVGILGGCATQQNTMMKPSLSMTLMNNGHPFVSERLAERLGLLIIEDRYPKDIFLTSGPGVVTGDGEVWRVTFDNSLVNSDDGKSIPMVNGVIVPRSLTITIRKKNGEILDIS